MEVSGGWTRSYLPMGERSGCGVCVITWCLRFPFGYRAYTIIMTYEAWKDVILLLILRLTITGW